MHITSPPSKRKRLDFVQSFLSVQRSRIQKMRSNDRHVVEESCSQYSHPLRIFKSLAPVAEEADTHPQSDQEYGRNMRSLDH